MDIELINQNIGPPTGKHYNFTWPTPIIIMLRTKQDENFQKSPDALKIKNWEADMGHVLTDYK